MLEWKFHTAKLFQCLVSCYQYLTTRIYSLTACLAYVLSVYMFRVHYLHKPREAGPFVAIQTSTADHFWLQKMAPVIGQPVISIRTQGLC